MRGWCVNRNRRPEQTWHPEVMLQSAKRLRKLFRRRWAARLPLLMLCVCIADTSQGQAVFGAEEITPGRMQSGSLLLRMKSGYAVATRIDTAIDATISGMVARVSVKQSFRNTGQEWVEGVYVFPLPDNAAVDRLRMRIGERFIEGEIREKEKARKEYEAAKKDGRKASLVEQQRANMFTTSVANIAPGERVTIEIEYLETLRYDDERFSLRFPITITPRYIPGTALPGRKGSGWSADTTRVPDASLITPPVVVSSAAHRLSFHASIDAGMPLEIIASRYHPVKVSDHGDRYEIELSGTDVPMDHDLELTWQPVADAAPRAMLFSETIDGQPHLLLMMMPPSADVSPETEIPREMIFIIDTSGSMHGTSIAQATRALTLALDGLQPRDRFNVIQFNSTTEALFRDAVDATANNIGIAKRFVSGLQANGGTEMRPAIELALNAAASEAHLRQVVFITDGSVGNERELFNLIRKQLGDTRLFTVGIGSAPNSWFMRKAAEAGRGTFTTISALHEVREKMERLFVKLEQPQVTDIAIQWPSGQHPLVYPDRVPDLYAGQPILVKARFDSDVLPGDIISISGRSPGGRWGAELPVDIQQSSPGVGALWARERIGFLLDRLTEGADEAETRQAVVETALTHHLVSRYTSLVAVDKTPVRPVSAALGREQVPNLLPYGQNHNAIFGFPATATPAAFYRVSGLLLIVFALLLLPVLVPGSRHREFAQAA